MMKRFLTFLLCLSLLLTAVACKKEKPQEPEEPSVYATYDDIAAEFTALLTAKYNGEELTAPNTEDMDERETAIAEVLYDIVNAHRIDATYPINLGYGYRDVDGNGTSEMFLMSQYLSVYAVFALSEGEPVLLEAVYDTPDLNHSFIFADRNRFFIGREKVIEDPVREYVHYICHVDGDQMVYDTVYGEVYDIEKKVFIDRFQEVDGTRVSIDEETFDEIHWERDQLSTSYHENVKLSAPYLHFPMNEPINTEGIPVADFSSYEAILETYKAISDCYPEAFNYRRWLYGEYDNLFVFSNDLAFEYYMQLFNTVRGNGERFGYDLIDLNGDGQDELVLLDEEYNIKAIFTQKEGVPVLLMAFGVDEICWLDGQGLIRVDRRENHVLEYGTYEFTQKGELHLLHSFCVKERWRYLTRDGKTEKITFEESLEWYDDYCVYPEHVKPNEYTRDVSKLTYTPLTQPTEDPVQAAVGKTWRTGGSMEETTGKNSAYYAIYMTLENVTDTQMDVNFKYAFTYYYKDPNQESTVPGISYYIPDTTESFLSVKAHKENGVFVFDENGIKGRIEFGQDYQWLIIEESTDERFFVGAHCCDEYPSDKYITAE